MFDFVEILRRRPLECRSVEQTPTKLPASAFRFKYLQSTAVLIVCQNRGVSSTRGLVFM
jgi:hypothetical protein